MQYCTTALIVQGFQLVILLQCLLHGDPGCAGCKVQAQDTLALGHLPCLDQWDHWSDVTSNGMPLPASMSQLTALSSLALLNVGWKFAPDGLPHLPQVCACKHHGGFELHPDLHHHCRNIATKLSRGLP